MKVRFRVGPGLLVRGAIGALLMVASVSAFLHYWSLAGAAVVAKRGWERATNQPGGYMRGMADLRRALRVDPNNPVYNVWVANLLFQRESERAQQHSLAHIEADRFHEALGLLRNAENTARNPTTAVMLMGDAATMLANYYRHVGNEEMEVRFSEVAAENYLTFRAYANFPSDRRAVGFYERAMGRSLHAGWPFSVLTFFDDLRLHHSRRTFENRNILDIAHVAYREMGEFPMMMTFLAIRAFEDPDDISILGMIQQAADENRQVPHALRVFETLHHQGRLPQQAVPVISQLELQMEMLQGNRPPRPGGG